ncbi:MAG: hypothetical protein FJZ16_01750, partial [Candidatus Omnitrophica bacterium]|nr:hypothetical protein [Candidatus Omnitrophota bacterium]
MIDYQTGKKNLWMRLIALIVAEVFLISSVPIADAFDRGVTLSSRQNEIQESDFVKTDRIKEVLKKTSDFIKERKDLEKNRNQVTDVVNNINKSVVEGVQEKVEGEFQINRNLIQARTKRLKIAGSVGEFNYVQYDDGMIVYSKDGLTSRIENERIVDPLGNVTIKNTDNMQYNDKRLLVSYDAEIIDPLGNTTTVKWYGATYTPDSVFYGGDETNANKNITGYTQEVTDALGNTTNVNFKDATYSGKLLSTYIREVTDNLGNITKEEFSNPTYDDAKRLISYHLVTTDTFGNVTLTDRVSTTYNNKDLVTDYTEIVSDLQGNSLTTEWHGQYNDFNQLTGYTKKDTDESGNITETQWHSPEYDKWDRLVSYKIDKKGLTGVQTKEETWNTLDNYGRVTNSKTKYTDGLGVVTEEDTIYTYNNKHQLTSSSTTRKDQTGVITLRESSYDYDKYGRIVNTDNIYSQTIDGNKLVTKEEISYTYYNSFCKVKSQYVKRIDPAGVETLSETTYEYNSFNLLSHAVATYTEYCLSDGKAVKVITAEDTTYNYNKYKQLETSITKRKDAAGVESIN